MSYSSIQDDNDIISRYSVKNKIEFAPELSQGDVTTKNNMVKYSEEIIKLKSLIIWD